MSISPPAVPPLKSVPGYPLLEFLRRIWRNYYVRIVGQGLLTIWAVTTFTFFLIRQMPGNPVETMIDDLMTRQSLTYEEAYRAAATLFNFDPNRPVTLQYLDFVGGLVRGDLGDSITRGGVSVTSLIVRYLPWTLFCVGSALLISFVLGTLLGLAMGYWRGSWLDNGVTLLASIISGIPDYILALLIILVFGVQLQWFKVGDVRGGVDPNITPGLTFEYIFSILQYALLPMSIYILSSIGTWILSMKSSTISTLGEDYITVAKARGLSQGRILTDYVGRNAMLPLLTRLAISVGFVVGGSVIIEDMFQYPGLGRNLYIAITGRDYTTMQGIFLVITSAVVFSNILADMAMGWLDPRVRLRKGEETS
ncbi:MAG TPA: ABC transporter permease [Aggregatilineales bacterium]|nr:ABC transporter permease [Aggregatilineales bacterium]